MAPTLAPSWKVLPLAVGLAAMAGGLAAGVAHRGFGVSLPLSAACSLAMLWVTARRVGKALADDPQRAFALALGVAGASPFVAAWVWILHVDAAWVESFRGGFVCGPIVPPGPAAAIAALPLGVALAEKAARGSPRPAPAAARVALSMLATAIAVLSVLGLLRGVSRPTPGSRLAGLPVIATLQAPSAPSRVETHPLGPTTLTVACAEAERSTRCHVFLHRGGQASLHDRSLTPERPSDVDSLTSVEPGATLQVLREARRDLWIVQTPILHGSPVGVAAFRGPALERVDLSLLDFPGDFAPPVGWPVAALLGVGLAASLLGRARFVAPLPADALADATLAADGTVRLPGGDVLAAPPLGASGLPSGPVVIVRPSPGQTYRDGATATVLRAGTIAEWRDALVAERRARGALALSTLVLLGTPMFVAASAGMLG